MKPKITLKDIARELDVSISTVSKALKNSKEISKETKDKIKAFAKFYNYRPNNIALSLKNKRTKNIGVVIPDIVHHFFTTVFRGIEKYANAMGYNVIVCISDESYDKEVINMEMLANGSIDGFILSLSAETQKKNDFTHLKELLDQGIPIVLFDRITSEIDCDKVILNDFEAAGDSVTHFVKAGAKKIALITTEKYFNVSESRKEGYLAALKLNNIALDDRLILTLPHDRDNTNLITEFFQNNDVDAVLCVNEIFAIQCMSVIQHLGYTVPDDISIIGFTDGILSRYSSPQLSTVAQHGEKMGELAAKLLIQRMESVELVEEPFKTEVINATLVKRGSTIN
ncbi:LacI family DNA-binding transcriptional regulator [Maribacter dokdonensis]|uniref:LacI family DNA-binding transcriptional regulator n=1 Tax=Maribacter dokdonensis TaxID=320912 RepID=UPI001C0837AE|nr:LacI family DNA-binding transcriptional regulator [Maribacter dokdonensis]MBU2901027.1 LacI family transcriptional regulator [Maribacter dokdonensis]MDP2526229.1 LacI family DNA-binding transcriptional regulator [Maribacter dokdonensis]